MHVLTQTTDWLQVFGPVIHNFASWTLYGNIASSPMIKSESLSDCNVCIARLRGLILNTANKFKLAESSNMIMFSKTNFITKLSLIQLNK